MTTFPSITGNRLIRALRKFGFEVIRVKGSHQFLQHQDGRCTVVPVHRGESIGRGLLNGSQKTALAEEPRYVEKEYE
jgi:predicted RNA binding protein YcfA (HicA-like mRNA interferase family)